MDAHTPLPFAKYEGAGNDFIIVDALHPEAITPATAQLLCDRHFGIGADGVLLVLPPTSANARATMRVLNADGSVPEMCGNGLRCVASYVATREAVQQLVIDTGAGAKTCIMHESDVAIDMGVAKVLGARELLGEPLIQVETGNPHAVLFGTYTADDIARLGPALAKHPSFPNGTNVEFARIVDDGIELVVWERGVGLTLACGTGAVATVAAAQSKGLVPGSVRAQVRVHLPGGVLSIERTDDGSMRMTGPARKVFEGTYLPRSS